MLVAVLSDSHGRVEVVQRALALLAPMRPAVYLHCGDVGGEEIFDQFVGLPLHFVWGNTDMPTFPLRTYVQSLGFAVPNGPQRLTLDGKHVAVFHGHEREFEREMADPTVDYLFHGHTHEKADHRVGGVRIINPGALHRARVKTVATLDTATDVLTFHVVPPE